MEDSQRIDQLEKERKVFLERVETEKKKEAQNMIEKF